MDGDRFASRVSSKLVGLLGQQDLLDPIRLFRSIRLIETLTELTEQISVLMVETEFLGLGFFVRSFRFGSSVRFYSAHPIPASLSNATALVALNLANNSFAGQVPAEIGTLCALSLELSNNKLTAIDAGGGWEFVDNLTKCSALAEILLYGNKFAGVMPSFVKLKNLYCI
uniref:Uncharacterized protein n=1 Tax=Oryza sativa subsp. japonica TaxID=39947 RepID=Q6K6F6_ORYSJ|nr:hypothetical protein [Oryza sativa Japonica Group]